MYSLMHSGSVLGVEGQSILVETDISSGLPQVNVVGLPDPAVRESVERVRAAIKNSGYKFPLDRITVNLAPADLRKEGTAFDLAIAAGILTASGQLDGMLLERVLLIGELALNGQVRPVPGVLALLEMAKRSGIRKVLLPLANAEEAAWIGGMELFAIADLRDLAQKETSGWEHIRYDPSSVNGHPPKQPFHDEVSVGDYSDVIGQQQAKRAMLVAAAGRHNIVLIGPPGTGKTMMIRRLPTILPPLSEEESLEVTKIYSAAGKLDRNAAGLIQTPPFRSPHHTISSAGLIGGGSIPKPGEVTLAHRGILYLDELAEFSRPVLEVLRQPLEDHMVTIARAKAVFRFPAQIMLAASLNPCPCGYFGHDYGDNHCTCSPTSIARYRSKISGPLLDRIDLQLEVPRASAPAADNKSSLSSREMRHMVEEARARQAARHARDGHHGISRLSGAPLRRAAHISKPAAELMDQAFQMLGISMRAYDRILRLARTIADIGGCEHIGEEHVAEALQYRRMDQAAVK
ncbi:YifB family Mg chelatase-like AAA ATPase [Paenibacillus protaetiae]|uniref:ATP-binding protein n=1 Tax=Paenibacillus protaetiae TaxID=2509456 RepID=A0A4P6EY72_9BACL|nr:YifB family Mg chelatase-like AAA ATPase [Paenibacillus protaetiae]QAY65587.1 ATP-binding protein [Paenibacillus protaetiae]